MRKIFLLLAAMCCLVINSYAAIVINFGGVFLYDDKDATPYEGVTWKASTRTLTLNNANISIPSSDYGLYITPQSVTIVVQGKNTLNVAQVTAIDDPYGALSIVGASNDAELTVISGSSTAINATQGCSLGGGSYPLKLNLQGATYGIYHSSNSLSIANNVTLNIAATTGAAISGSGSVTLAPGLCVTKPLGAEFDGGTLILDGKVVTSAVTIEPYNLTEYNLWIEGKRVNDLNQSDILQDKKVSYNPTTKTLTLDNTDIAGGTKNSAIKTSISGLKIDVQGTCYLTSSSSTLPAVQCSATTTLTSSGANAKVTIQNPNNAAIINDGCALNIDGGSYGMTVNIDGKSGIQGKNSSADLSIKNATVGFSSTTNGAIYGQNSINLNDLSITSPAGAKIYNGAIVDSKNQVVTSAVKIQKVEKYALYIAGTQVTDLNCSDILGDGGKVKYDNATKTLTLSGATISSSTDAPINSTLGTLKLVCNGTNTLSYTGSSQYIDGLNLISAATITTTQANSSLTVTGSRAGIVMGTSNVLIDGNNFGLTLNLKGKQYGFYGSRGEGGGTGLTIKDANVNIDATTTGAINNVSSLTLTNVAVNEPTGCAYSTSNYALMRGGSVVKTAVKIGKPIEKYGVLIKGEQVTSENCNDILGDGGKVKYDNATKTLTLNNATISYAGDVISLYDDINIKCIGENKVEATDKWGDALVEDAGSITILGTGSVSFKAQSAAINLQHDLTIKGGCTITAQSADNVAVALGGEPLTVDGSTLIAKGNGKNATIAGCNSLVMKNGAQISSKHTYDATLHKFYIKGTETEATDDIKIGVPTKYGIKIAGIEVTDENKDAITGESITGSVSYDPETATLTLDNANIDYTQTLSEAILITGDVKYINCIGENIVICKGMNSYGIYFKETDITIKGTGTLSVKGQWSGIISLKGAHTLSIVGCEVTVEGELNYAIYFDVNGGTLKVDSGTLIAKGNGHITIGNCFNLVMNNGVAIRSNHTYDATLHKFLNSKSEEATDDIVIGVEGTGIEEVHNAECTMHDVRKVMRDGQLLIIREGKNYNAQGQEL